MKKSLISAFLIAILALSSISSSVFASDISSWTIIQSDLSTQKVAPVSNGSSTVQPMGLRAWVVKQSLKTLAWSLDTVASIKVFKNWWVATYLVKYSTVIRNTLISLSTWQEVSITALQDQIVGSLISAWCSRSIATNIAFAIKELVQIVFL